MKTKYRLRFLHGTQVCKNRTLIAIGYFSNHILRLDRHGQGLIPKSNTAYPYGSMADEI